MYKRQGTFEWNGKEYRAKQAYIDQLTAYLCREDVDLSADTCAAAATEMYGNVERGVTEGYLYEVGGSGDTAADTREAMESEVGSQEEKGYGQEGLSGDEERSDKQTGERSDEPFEEWPGNKLDEKFKKCDPVIFRLPGSWWFGENRTGGEDAGTGVGTENGWLRLLDPTLYCLITVCEAVCSVILITALAQTARNRSLKRRSKARKALQTIVICMTAGACFLSGLLLSLRIGAFSETVSYTHLRAH